MTVRGCLKTLLAQAYFQIISKRITRGGPLSFTLLPDIVKKLFSILFFLYLASEYTINSAKHTHLIVRGILCKAQNTTILGIMFAFVYSLNAYFNNELTCYLGWLFLW